MNSSHPNRQQYFSFQNTERVLNHMNLEGWSPERKALVLRVFSLVVEWETQVNAAKLLDLAEKYPQKSVAELVESMKKGFESDDDIQANHEKRR
jgi:hypothetical protein